MKQVLELWTEAHEAYLRARAASDKSVRRRMLSIADAYLKQAEELRRDKAHADPQNK